MKQISTVFAVGRTIRGRLYDEIEQKFRWGLPSLRGSSTINLLMTMSLSHSHIYTGDKTTHNESLRAMFKNRQKFHTSFE